MTAAGYRCGIRDSFAEEEKGKHHQIDRAPGECQHLIV